MCGDARTDFQPVMELFASRLDKLEEDFVTRMRSTSAPPSMVTPSPNVQTHDIVSPAETAPASDDRWNPLNPQRPESYGHQPRMGREATADPWSQPQPQPTQSASYGEGLQGQSTWAAGAGFNLRPTFCLFLDRPGPSPLLQRNEVQASGHPHQRAKNRRDAVRNRALQQE